MATTGAPLNITKPASGDTAGAAVYTTVSAALQAINDVIVTLTDTQTLTAKTLTSPVLTTPTIASFANAAHTHANAAGGGAVAWAGISAVVNDLLPWLIDIDVFMTPIANTNWATPTLNTSYIHNGYQISSGDQNAIIGWDVVLGAGTWTVEVMHGTGTDRGIYSVRFDDAEKGTFDGYAAGAINVLSSVASIAVATAAKIRLTLKMATKHASSSGYIGIIQHVQLRRTA